MMKNFLLLVVSCLVSCAAGWSAPYYPMRVARTPLRQLAPPPPPVNEIPVFYGETELEQNPSEFYADPELDESAERPKRDRDEDSHHEDHDRPHDFTSEEKGIAGPVHTFVKTDKNANYKWGVRHHVGNKYAT